MEIIAVVEKVLELFVGLLGRDTVHALLEPDAIKRARAVADAAEALKFSGKAE